MLVEFRVANFRSFREEQIFSLVASKDEKLPGNLITTPRFNLLKSAAIYGANASGKSNLVKAMQFFHRFVSTSATRVNQGDPIQGISPFRLDVDSRTKPATFEITLLLDKTLYRYGFSATRDKVHDEWLVVKAPRGRNQGWFERRYDPKTTSTTWTFRGPLVADRALLKERTRDNGLALSRGAELNVKPLSKLFLSLGRQICVFDFSKDPEPLMLATMDTIRRSPEFAGRVLRMVRDADLGIEHVEIADLPHRSTKLPPLDGLPEILREVYSDLESVQSRLSELSGKFLPDRRVKTLHRTSDLEQVEQFDMKEDESNGTVRFFALTGPILSAIEHGAIIVIDEIDCSMHPLLTRKLIELFQSQEVNRSGAQLVFTTHDSSLMDLSLFRRDQIWLAEKTAAFATELSSLYDFEERPRNTEAVERNYLTGRYGGVPHFGATFEDLELK